MATLPVLIKLPKAYLEAIGAICFEWAHVERGLREITFGLLRVGPKHGRVAVRTPRGYEQLVMIRQLMQLEGLTSRRVNLDKLSTFLKRMEKDRDLFAHGTWMLRRRGRKRDILIQDFAGTWKPDPKGEKVTRRMHPEGVIVDAATMLEAAKGIRTMRPVLDTLARELSEQLASRHTPQQQSDLPDPPERPIEEKP